MRFYVIAFATCIALASSAIHKRAAPPARPRVYPDWNERGQEALQKALDWKPLFKAAKNVVFFLGDGMGVSTSTAARFFKAQYETQTSITDTIFSWEAFPVTGMIQTYSMDGQATDSSSAATAFLCGEKALTGAICVNQNVERGDCEASLENELTSVVHQAIMADKATGVISTATTTDATPATTYSHVPDRKWYADVDVPEEYRDMCWDISRQLIDVEINQKLKVVLGGGRRDFYPNNETDPEYPDQMGRRLDGRNLPKDWRQQKLDMGVDSDNVYYVENQAQFDQIDPETAEYVFGLFEYYDMKYEADRRLDKADDVDWQEPSLAEMTEKALKILMRNKDEEGFFLFVEGARIDHAHHDNEPLRSLMDVVAMDEAVAKALEMVDLEDTLVLVSADHSHPFSQVEALLEDDILGLATDVSANGELRESMDSKPYTILSYINGPGFLNHRTENTDINNIIPRINLTGVDTTGIHYRFDTSWSRSSSTHSAEDVVIYVTGPMAHLFNGQNEQSYIAHAIRYINCLGDGKTMCEDPPEPLCDDSNNAVVINSLGRPLLTVLAALIVCLKSLF